MKYTFLINSLRNGGAERVLLTLAEEFIRQGDRVTIISLTKTNAYPIPKEVEMVYLTEVDDGNSALKRMLLIPYYAWKLRNYSKKYQPKIIQSHIFRSNLVNIISCCMGAKHQTQLVNHSVASRYLSSGLMGRFNLFLMALFYPKADVVITISKKMLEDLKALIRLPKKQIVIYNPYNTKQIIEASKEVVHEFAFDKNKRYIVTVGRLIPLKQYDDVIRVLEKLPSDTELLMLGDDGGEQKKLEALREQLGIQKRVHFMGQVENPFKFIRQCDVFVSSSRTEGFPNVLIESMLCRTVVVSSDCISGPREILAPKSSIDCQLVARMEKAHFGLLYPVGSLSHLEKAIRTVLDDDVLRIGYEKRAFERARSFSVKKIAQHYQELMRVE